MKDNINENNNNNTEAKGKISKKIIIVFVVLLIFILNTLTFKGYYYTVTAKNNKVTTYIKWNKVIQKDDYPTTDPKEEYRISGTDSKLINILNTFYLTTDGSGKKAFHLHFILFDFSFSKKGIETYFYHGNGNYYVVNRIQKM